MFCFDKKIAVYVTWHGARLITSAFANVVCIYSAIFGDSFMAFKKCIMCFICTCQPCVVASMCLYSIALTDKIAVSMKQSIWMFQD